MPAQCGVLSGVGNCHRHIPVNDHRAIGIPQRHGVAGSEALCLGLDSKDDVLPVTDATDDTDRHVEEPHTCYQVVRVELRIGIIVTQTEPVELPKPVCQIFELAGPGVCHGGGLFLSRGENCQGQGLHKTQTLHKGIPQREYH